MFTNEKLIYCVLSLNAPIKFEYNIKNHIQYTHRNLCKSRKSLFAKHDEAILANRGDFLPDIEETLRPDKLVTTPKKDKKLFKLGFTSKRDDIQMESLSRTIYEMDHKENLNKKRFSSRNSPPVTPP